MSRAVAIEIVEGRITPPREDYSADLSHPVFLRAQNIEEGVLRLEDAKRVTPKAFGKAPKAIVNPGEIVLTIDGALLGKAAVFSADELDCCISNHMVRIRPGHCVTPAYLAAFLNGPSGQKQIRRGITGSAIPGLRTDAIERIVVPVPSISEQQTLVSRLDFARNQRKTLLDRANELILSMGERITDSLGLTLKNPRFSGAVRLKDIDGPINVARYLQDSPASALRIESSIPLDVAFDIIEEKVSPVQAGPKADWDCFRIDDLENEPLDSPSPRRVRGTELAGSYFPIQKNDLLVARLGPPLLNGKIVVVDMSGERSVCSPEFLVLRPNGKYDPNIARWILRSRVFRRLLYSRSRGSTPSRYRLLKSELAGIRLPLLGSQAVLTIAREIERDCQYVRQIRAEADVLWRKAKTEFETALLKSDPPQEISK